MQESNDGCGSAGDDALELAYEQHLRQLHQLHSSAASGQQHQQPQQRCKGNRKARRGPRQQKLGRGSSQAGVGVQRERQAVHGGGAVADHGPKRRRRGGGPAAGVAGSVDTLASAAALAVPAAHPVQQQAQISFLSAEAAAGAAAAEPAIATAAAATVTPLLAWQPLVQGPFPGAAPAAVAPVLAWQPLAPAPQPPQLVLAQPIAAGQAAAASGQLNWGAQQQAQRPDASAVAALVEQAMAEEEADSLAASAASKTVGICRLDLSASALLISSHLALCADPLALGLAASAGGGSGQGLPVATAVEAEEVAGVAEVEDATEAAAEGGQEGAAAASRRAQRRTYVHGNYHRYYGYRFFGTLPAGEPDNAAAAQDQQQPEDPRLAAFERKWFARRRCLDVGCNEGVVTLALVQRFCTRSMLGVDIDGVLVAKANRWEQGLLPGMGYLTGAHHAGCAQRWRPVPACMQLRLLSMRCCCCLVRCCWHGADL